MKKILYIFAITAFFLLSCTYSCYAEVILTYPADNSIVPTSIVTFQWENTDTENEYLYRFYLSEREDWAWSIGTRDISKTEYTRRVTNVSYSWWYVEYCIKTGETCTPYLKTPIHKFKVGDIEVKEEIAPTTETEPKEEETESKDETVKSATTSHPTVSKPKEKSISKTAESTEESINWDIDTLTLSIDTDYVLPECKFEYITGRKNAEIVDCNPTGFLVTQSSAFEQDEKKFVDIKGRYINKISVVVDIYTCDRKIFSPKSWFTCEKKFKATNKYMVFPSVLFEIYADNTNIPVTIFNGNQNTFELIAGEYTDVKRMVLRYTFKFVMPEYGIKITRGGEFDIPTTSKVTLTSKPFIFPFKDNIGVTQWHGDTSYQKPHTGIDFGAVKEEILAVSNGEVVAKGWDNFNGECMSGGNYLVTKQSNGMYVAYFHLQSTSVDTGDKIKKGDVLGISGNTGSWNCQSLGYHLHFETRLKRSQNTHVDPVKYISADWANILTLNAKQYPGRLSGDNPHPGK